jgi:hypothetical protein
LIDGLAFDLFRVFEVGVVAVGIAMFATDFGDDGPSALGLAVGQLEGAIQIVVISRAHGLNGRPTVVVILKLKFDYEMVVPRWHSG